ncbi:response regulator [Roseomonas sp. M0104]|uniref:histidine kinase n=1 Tax=Teichococcus coralli TaxID=2545983 RepID=A0A845BK99_9PROT|nr:response regulator [Pseudoroseomonas coralli]MXP65707.1 response regulator [Pseudoroseomonas coralli]
MVSPLSRTGLVTLIATATVLLLFLGGGAFALRVLEDTREQRAAVNTSYAIMASLLELRSDIHEVTVARDLVLLGTPEPYRHTMLAARERIVSDMAALEEAAQSDAQQQTVLPQLRRGVAAMLTRLERTLGFAGRGDAVDLLLLIREAAAERMRLLRMTDQMIAWERADLEASNSVYTVRVRQARAIIPVTFVAAVLFALAALWSLHRYRHSSAERYAALEDSKRATEAANAALTENRSRLQSILDHASDPILLLSGADQVQLANAAAADQFGLPLTDVIGQPIRAFIPAFGQPQREVEAHRADGSVFPAELSIGRYEQDGERGCVCVLRDVTERRRLDSMKNEFVSTVSHELRTPLTSIRAALGLVTGGAAGALPQPAGELLGIAHKNAERLVLLVNDILDIEKMEAGRLEFRRERISARQLLEQAVEANRAYAGQFGLRLEVAGDPEADAEVYADAPRIQQVLANLLSNAAKFSPAGSAVEVSLGVNAGSAVFRVRDRGPGIPEAFRGRIFQRFAQADSSDVRQKGGTGLGLAISRAIVEHHAGSIGFEDAEGGGTCFHFSLPRLVERLPVAPAASGQKRRVLIVEDDADVARLLQMMLAQHGWEGHVAHDAAEAFAQLDRQRFDALTLDLMLPDDDGLSVLRRLRQRPEGRGLPVVVVSAIADQRRRALNGDAMGVVDWLDKPIDQGRLREALHQALRASASGGAEEGPARVLHVEDDDDIRHVVSAVMGDEAQMQPARSLAEARAALAAGTRFALVIIDLGLPDGSGFDLLPDIQALRPTPPVLIFSASDTDARMARHAAATLVKSRTENRLLHDTIRHLIEAAPHAGPAKETAL